MILFADIIIAKLDCIVNVINIFIFHYGFQALCITGYSLYFNGGTLSIIANKAGELATNSS